MLRTLRTIERQPTGSTVSIGSLERIGARSVLAAAHAPA